VGSSTLELVVVDPSGTLLVDDDVVGTALAEALGVVDVHLDGPFCETLPGYVANTRGISMLGVLRSLVGDDDRARYALCAFERAFPSVLAQGGVDVLHGVEAAMATLRQAGRQVCLMSRLPQSCIDAVVRGLEWDDLVDLTVAPAAGTRTPPHPDLVLAAIVQLGVAGVRDVAVVADSANPLVAGTRAGASAVVGVIGGTCARVELERVPHTHVVHSFLEVPALLDVVSTRVDAAYDAA
jgi:phosphonatase-like hydrolase